MKHGVRMIATIEAQMNSVERVIDYTANMTPEAALDPYKAVAAAPFNTVIFSISSALISIALFDLDGPLCSGVLPPLLSIGIPSNT
jgi:hypothetical protein